MCVRLWLSLIVFNCQTVASSYVKAIYCLHYSANKFSTVLSHITWHLPCSIGNSPIQLAEMSFYVLLENNSTRYVLKNLDSSSHSSDQGQTREENMRTRAKLGCHVEL